MASTLWKLGWLRAFSIVVRNSKDVRSVILNFLKTEKFAMLVMSSVTILRGALPNGVPKMCWEVKPFMMNRTWSLVTVVTGTVDELNEFTLTSVFPSNPRQVMHALKNAAHTSY